MLDEGRKYRPVQARTLRREVADVLREAILTGRLEAGHRLVEADLARDLDTSRVPVREAISQLEQQGLVTVIPNQGACVLRPSLKEAYQALDLRIYIETLAARLASARRDPGILADMAAIVRRMEDVPVNGSVPAMRVWQAYHSLDWDFHALLVLASGSEFLRQTWSASGPYTWATVHFGRVARGHNWADGDRLAQGLRADAQLHWRLLDAIRSGDADRAAAEVRVHHPEYQSAVPERTSGDG